MAVNNSLVTSIRGAQVHTTEAERVANIVMYAMNQLQLHLLRCDSGQRSAIEQQVV